MTGNAHLDREEILWALQDADIPVLLMVLAQLTGNRKWIEYPYLPRRDIRLFPDESGGLPERIQDEVRAAAYELLADGDPSAAKVNRLDRAFYAQMMSVCVGEPVPDEYIPMFLEEMHLAEADSNWRTTPDTRTLDNTNVLIIGAGVCGLCAAIRLAAAGIRFMVVDKNPEVGGTWFENTYPESGVDTPNHFYSYSFKSNISWTSYFAKQAEMLEYLKECVRDFRLENRIQLSATVVRAVWDGTAQHWLTTVQRADGTTEDLVSSAIVCATGQLNRPAIPQIEGIETFAGPLFHTARWRHDVDLSGKRVGIVGTGASSMQIARTSAEHTAHLTIFQRSPQWVVLNRDYDRSVSARKRWLLANVPHYAQWYRFVLFWRFGDGLHRSLIVDPDWPNKERSINESNDRHRRYMTDYLLQQLEGRQDLIEKTLPDYPPYGKRILMDNDWFRTIRRGDVDLVTEKIHSFSPGGAVLESGQEIELDVVIMATGFHARRFVWPIEVIGRHKRLDDQWAGENATAYLGITVPGFPNFFLMHGPNTALAHGGSVIFHAECQARYIMGLLMRMLESGIAAVNCKETVHDEYMERVDAAHSSMIWTHPGMTNWYRNEVGRVVCASPWRLIDYWTMTHDPDLGDYEVCSADDRS